MSSDAIGGRLGRMENVVPAGDRHLVHEELTRRILASAMLVHRRLGPGLLESAYRACFRRQLALDGLSVRHECPISLVYEGTIVEHAYRADLVVDEAVLVELKAAENLLPVHHAQLLTYLKLSKLRVGLLINFNVRHLKNGFIRYVR